MKNIFAIMLLFISACSFAQDDTPNSIWVNTPIQIDGKATDWKLPLNLYDDGTRLFFAIANDDKNVYLCFQEPNDMFQTKILGAGIEVSVSARSRQKVSVKFPLAKVTDVAPGDDNADLQMRHTNFILQNNMMSVEGFATRQGVIPINDTSGIQAAMNWDARNILTYEIAIPFREWPGTGYTLADMAKDITIEVTINALKQSRSSREGNIAGVGKIGEGRKHQHADNNAESHVMPGEYKYDLYQKTKMKQKFELAQNGSRK